MLQMIRRNGDVLQEVDPRDGVAEETAIDISSCIVGVLGCGSLGSHAAYALASRGVRHLILADKDELSKDNLRRHLCGGAWVGQPKSQSVAAVLEDHFPNIEIEPHHFCFKKDADRLRELIELCHAVVVAINSQGEGMKYPINDMLWQLQKPGIFTGLYGNGWGAELILVDASRFTSCYACAANGLGRFGYEVSSAGDRTAYTTTRSRPTQNGFAAISKPGHERDANQRPTQVQHLVNGWAEANLTSILPTSALTANLMIAVLEAQAAEGHRLHEFRTDEEASVWRLALRRVREWDLGPWSLQPVPVSANTACPLQCGMRCSPSKRVGAA